jgi:hypothetical protein
MSTVLPPGVGAHRGDSIVREKRSEGDDFKAAASSGSSLRQGGGRVASFARRRHALPVVLLFLGALAAAIMLLATERGVGLSSDSLIYINASGNLLEGRGLSRLSGVDGTRPITHYPPPYPPLLAGLQLLGMGRLAAARALQVLSFGGSEILLGLALWRMTRHRGPIPLPGDPVTGQAVTSYADDLLARKGRIMEGEAAMVLFFASPGEGRIPTELGQGLTLLCGENGVRLYVGDEYRGPRECGP